MKADNMNPDQTAPWEQFDLVLYCLSCRVHKYIIRLESRGQSYDRWANG